ncbi:MAG TPA: MFS transporter, partial [Ktedonobacterales bacterium]|nr:MFS transporter [Ktedonobacterales bacterium]
MLANSLARFRGLRRNARLYVISNTIQAASAGALGVLYTLFLSSLGYGPDFIGVVLVIGTIGGGLGILPASPLAARLGWRRVLLLSDLVGGVAVAVQFVFPTPPVIIVTTLGVGASVALFLVVNAPFLAANSTPTERIALFGLSTALGYLAAVAGSLLGGFLPGWMSHTALFTALAPVLDHSAQARAYQLSLLVAGALSLPSIIPILLLRDEQPPAAETLAQAPLSPLGRVAPAIDAPILPVAGALSPAPTPPLDSAKRLQLRMRLDQGVAALRGAIGRFTITQALVGFGAGMFFPYVNLYFVNQLHATTEYFGVLSALLTVLLAL